MEEGTHEHLVAQAKMNEAAKMNMQNTFSRRSEQISDSVPRLGLIHPSFPAMGPEKRAHEGSQSTTPEKGNP